LYIEKDIIELLVSVSNIPIHKLYCNPLDSRHSSVKTVFGKHTKQKIPNKSAIRKNYIQNIYINVLEKIINDIRDN